jgi:lactoylglutathione lyase
MELGAFSISLAVQDLAKSQAFYEGLGFSKVGGQVNYAILMNGTTIIGLFEKMFERNMLTFNPGLANDREQIKAFRPHEHFTDVRDIQATIEAHGVALDTAADPEGTGPAHFMIIDPDGNPILVDQHFPRPH